MSLPVCVRRKRMTETTPAPPQYRLGVVMRGGASIANADLMSDRSAGQIMTHNAVFTVLRRDAVDALREDTMFFYEMTPVGAPGDNGYLAELMPRSRRVTLFQKILRFDPTLDTAGTGLVLVQADGATDCFAPSISIECEAKRAHIKMFYFGGYGEPPPRMVTLKGWRAPAPFLARPPPDATAERMPDHKRYVVGVLERDVDLSVARQRTPTRACEFILRTSAVVALKHHCRACDRIVSGRTKCGRCRGVTYCDKECQLADWPRHRAECVA